MGLNVTNVKVIRKANPLQAWQALSAPGGSDSQTLQAIYAYRPPLPLEYIPDTHFCLEAESTQSHSVAGTIKSIKNTNDTIGNRTPYFPACSTLP